MRRFFWLGNGRFKGLYNYWGWKLGCLAGEGGFKIVIPFLI